MRSAPTKVRANPRRKKRAGLTELVVDYAEVGMARRFPVTVSASERSAIRVGSTVMLIGDAVEPARARVIAYSGPTTVEVELL